MPLAEAGVGSGAPDCGTRPRPPTTTRPPPTTTSPRAPSARPTARFATATPSSPTLRAYTPELVGWFDGFSTSGLFDASGPLGRINTTFNAFSLALGSGLPDLLSPIDPADVLSGTGAVDVDNDQRCPGSTRA